MSLDDFTAYSCYLPVFIRVSNFQRCLLCYIRGGAMKSLVNPVNKCTGQPYWAHVVCALANPGCRFVDVPRRLAAVTSEAIEAAQSGARRAKKSRRTRSSASEQSSSSPPPDITTPGICEYNTSTSHEGTDVDSVASHSSFLNALMPSTAIENLFHEDVKVPEEK